MDGVLEFLLVLLFVGVAAATAVVIMIVIVLRRVWRAAREGGERVRLRVASYGAGHRAETAALRLTLGREIDAATRAITVARAQQWPVGDAPALLGQLRQRAAGLDAYLRAVEAEPHPEVARAALAAIRRDVATAAQAACDLRDGLRAGGLRLEAPALRAVAHECAVEKQALRAS